MKNYQSTAEGSWVELLKVELTNEQKELLISTDDSDKNAKTSLINLIKSQKEGNVKSTKNNELNNFYQSIKPELKEKDNYEFISVTLSEKEKGAFKGILNYRINGKHKQIRF